MTSANNNNKRQLCCVAHRADIYGRLWGRHNAMTPIDCKDVSLPSSSLYVACFIPPMPMPWIIGGIHFSCLLGGSFDTCHNKRVHGSSELVWNIMNLVKTTWMKPSHCKRRDIFQLDGSGWVCRRRGSSRGTDEAIWRQMMMPPLSSLLRHSTLSITTDPISVSHSEGREGEERKMINYTRNLCRDG